jgi:hypothetical protein
MGPPESSKIYTGLHPSVVELPAGHKRKEALRPLDQPMIFERDQALRLRNGIKINADIFSPTQNRSPRYYGMGTVAGNSLLAISQWFITAERPPHLACIAPLRNRRCQRSSAGAVLPRRDTGDAIWSGTRTDHMRSVSSIFPIMYTLMTFMTGRNNSEDNMGILAKYPLAN